MEYVQRFNEFWVAFKTKLMILNWQCAEKNHSKHLRMLFCMWSSWKWSHMNLRIFQISWILLSMAKNRFIHCSSNHFNMHSSLCQWKSVQMRCLLVIFIYSIIVCVVEQQSQPASCKITNKRTTWNEVNWTEWKNAACAEINTEKRGIFVCQR